MDGPPLNQLVLEETKQKVNTLLGAQLKKVLREHGMAISGVKSAMQNRIIGRRSHGIFTTPVPSTQL
jgi:hypothetical protein